MESFEHKTKDPLSSDNVDHMFDLLLTQVAELDGDPSRNVSARMITTIVETVSQEQHRTRIQLSRAIEEYTTSWQPGDPLKRLRHTILAGLGLPNSTTERGVRAITRRLDGCLAALRSRTAYIDYLPVVDAIAKFYHEYPNEFEFRYVEELFRFSKPSSFKITSSLAAIMLGANAGARGRLTITDVVDAVFAADDLHMYDESEKLQAISQIAASLPTQYWSRNIFKLDNTVNCSPQEFMGRMKFLTYLLTSSPPLFAIFSVEDVTYIVRPNDLLEQYRSGQSTGAAICELGERLREPAQMVGSFSDESRYQDIIDAALRHSQTWKRTELTGVVVPLADYQRKKPEVSE